jgi:hypothetical protein
VKNRNPVLHTCGGTAETGGSDAESRIGSHAHTTAEIRSCSRPSGNGVNGTDTHVLSVEGSGWGRRENWPPWQPWLGNCDSGFRNDVHQAEFSVAEGYMCLIAYLILGLIAGWFVASQGVGNSGASDFRTPPQIFRPPYYSHPRHRQNPCPRGKLYVPGSVSPEGLEPVRGQRRVNRGARDRTVSEPPLNRPGIMPPLRQRIAAPTHMKHRSTESTT